MAHTTLGSIDPDDHFGSSVPNWWILVDNQSMVDPFCKRHFSATFVNLLLLVASGAMQEWWRHWWPWKVPNSILMQLQTYCCCIGSARPVVSNTMAATIVLYSMSLILIGLFATSSLPSISSRLRYMRYLSAKEYCCLQEGRVYCLCLQASNIGASSSEYYRRPSTCDYVKIVESGMLRNWWHRATLPQLSKDIFGPKNLGLLKWKGTCWNSAHVPSLMLTCRTTLWKCTRMSHLPFISCLSIRLPFLWLSQDTADDGLAERSGWTRGTPKLLQMLS